MGSTYLRGKVWWIKYYLAGRPIRESSKCNRKKDAEAFLAIREGDIAKGASIIHSGKIPFALIIDDFVRDHLNNNRKSIYNMAQKLKKNVLPFFGNMQASEISPAIIERYKELRKRKVQNATINRELAWIRRALRLAARSGKLHYVPEIALLKENAPRSGFFEWDEVDKMLKYLPSWVRPIILFAYWTGWRKSEILNLQWQFVDFAGGEIRIPAGGSKNDQPRILFMTAELRELLTAQKESLKDCDNKLCPWVFHHNGERITSFRTAWEIAREKAELKHKLFHDFRRTAARNLARAGIQTNVAMAMMGHKTRHIYDRYNIVSEDDLKSAAAKLDTVGLARAQIRAHLEGTNGSSTE